MPTNSTIETAGADEAVAYDGTITLLEEEIARLEGELRLRDEIIAEAGRPAVHEPAADATAEGRIADLTADLTRREQEAALLWDEIRGLEEAEAAKQAEWEQLHQWISELERRIEGRADQERELPQLLDAQRRESESLRQQLETERRGWQAERKTFGDEVNSLRAKLSEGTASPGANITIKALQEENQKLRDECREMAFLAAIAGEADNLRSHLRTAEDALEEARGELRRTVDERERERNEHEAELASLRTQFARDLAKPREASGDDRLNAFREHLRELHEREEAERKSRHFSARLARLWRNTGPSR
jgi:chromosome segregation ATPase